TCFPRTTPWSRRPQGTAKPCANSSPRERPTAADAGCSMAASSGIVGSTAMQRLQTGLDHAPVHLAAGECRFRELPNDQGVELTLDGPTACYYAPGLFY